MLEFPLEQIPERSLELRRHFEARLSFPAMARELETLLSAATAGERPVPGLAAS